jgi:hypothetical protein
MRLTLSQTLARMDWESWKLRIKVAFVYNEKNFTIFI